MSKVGSSRPTKKLNIKNTWMNSSFGVCDNIENGTSDSDSEIEEINENTKPRPTSGAKRLLNRPTVSSLAVGPPLNRDNLAVHKKKVDEVDAWLFQTYNGPSNSIRPMILLINGPTGAGKTATLKVLASSKQIHLIEWTNPMDDIFESDRWKPGSLPGTSQASKFEDFLLSSARYNSVIGPSYSKKLILVEDYPNSLLLNPELFHNIIRKYLIMGKSPLVFITTDVNSGKNNTFNLFPPQIINELNMQNISFNPVSYTSLMKALTNIIEHKSLSNVAFETQSAICYSCNGDIRNAILALQYLAQDIPGNKMKKSIVMQTSRKRKAGGGKGKSSDMKGNKPAALEGKDCLTGMLHSVGRVLHAKREMNVVEGGGFDKDKRGFLKSNPQEIVNQYLSQHRHFVSLVHENYLGIFSDIHSISNATENICDADVLMNNWTERDLLKETGFSIAVRGVMNACNNPIHRWNPLQKPKWKEIELKSNEYLRNMQRLSSKLSCSNRVLCMDFENLYGTNINSRPSGTVDSAPVSPLPHITDDDDSD